MALHQFQFTPGVNILDVWLTELHNLRKLYFEEGKSITEISKETGRDRKTVRVYLEKEDWNDVRRGSMTEVEFPKLDTLIN
jgi:predicted DsbA family dithiol-disulfide isomerase